ncbi:MAG: hypothetical protein GWN47_04205 [Woeseiaceae bacterium]|nr:hypothetical protein [Woeseiaceae bacterium]
MTEDQLPARVKTPRHLWAIGILALLWDAVGAFDYFMTQTQNEAYMGQFTQEQLEFFYGFPAWVTALWAIAVWGGLLGAILLLLRKAFAAPVLLVSFIAMALTAFHNFVLSNGMEIMGQVGTIFSAVIFMIALGLWFYARAMQKRGVLT